MKPVRDLSGVRFGLWTAVCQYKKRYEGRNTLWLCQCDCGFEDLIKVGSLTSGLTRSCGCPLPKRASYKSKGRMVMTGAYSSWCAMIQRCTNPKATGYKYYGGRGIKVCDRWRGDFLSFLADMGERPPGLSIDRYPDNDGNYEPGNCRWATAKQQVANRRPYGTVQYSLGLGG